MTQAYAHSNSTWELWALAGSEMVATLPSGAPVLKAKDDGWRRTSSSSQRGRRDRGRRPTGPGAERACFTTRDHDENNTRCLLQVGKIGRASCRERGESAEVAGGVDEKEGEK